jgi:hypothetical protein
MMLNIKILSLSCLKHLLKHTGLKLEGLMQLPWFLQYISRNLSIRNIFYITDENFEVVVPIILLTRHNILKVAYAPSPYFSPKVLSLFNFGHLLEEIGSLFDYHILAIRYYPHDNVFYTNYFVKDRADLFIDLKKDPVDLYYSFKKRHRYTIRKSLGMSDSEILKKIGEDPFFDNIVIESSNYEGIKTFSRLLIYQLTKIAKESKFGVQALINLSSYYSLENLTKVWNILGKEGLLRIFFAQRNQCEPQAGVALFVSKNYLYSPMAYWWLGASTYDGERKGLPTILQFAVMNILKRDGYERYFLGGIGNDLKQASSGTTLFKKGFGGEFKQGYLSIYLRNFLFGKNITLNYFVNNKCIRFLMNLSQSILL